MQNLPLPSFANEQEESDFWDDHSPLDYGEWVEVPIRFRDARPRKTLISLRLEPKTIARLKAIAHGRHMGYQTLLRQWVLDRLAQEETNT